MNLWAALAIVIIVAVITYAMRAGLILALADRALPVAVERALQSVGPAVLAALAVNLAAGGDGGPTLHISEVAALVVAGFTAWWRRNLLVTLAAGMATLWIVAWLAG